MNILTIVFSKLSIFRKIELCCYVLLSIFSIAAVLFFHNTNLLLNTLLLFLCVVSILKLFRRIHSYTVLIKKRRVQTRKQARLQYFASAPSQRSYILYVRFIMCVWLIFIIVCLLLNRLFAPPAFLFLGGVFLLYGLDIVFYSAFCFLNFFANRLFNTQIRCCYLCPVRGWDLLMINLPLLFIWPSCLPILKPLLLFVFILSIIGFLMWEYGKFFILPVSQPLPTTAIQQATQNKNNTPCKHCKRRCGEEYNGRRSCMRRYAQKEKSL